MNGTTRLPHLSRLIFACRLSAVMIALITAGSYQPTFVSTTGAQPPAGTSGDDLQIEINKKGPGKEVVIHKGTREWYMLVEVAEGNTVVIRQEKEGDTYLLDESETHDRALSKGEIDDVIEAFINSIKMRTQNRK